MHPAAPLLLLIAVLAASAGCSADPAPSASAPAGGDGTALIAPEALASFVPAAPAGWRLLAPPSATALEEDGTPIASATASYLSDDGARSADLAIQDTAGRPVGLRRLAGAAGNDTTMLAGRPAVVSDGPVAGAYLVVADRYVVRLAVANGTRADLETFAAALDLAGLEATR